MLFFFQLLADSTCLTSGLASTGFAGFGFASFGVADSVFAFAAVVPAALSWATVAPAKVTDAIRQKREACDSNGHVRSRKKEGYFGGLLCHKISYGSTGSPPTSGANSGYH